MRASWPTLGLLLAISGCTDLVTVELGAGRVSPIEVRQEVPLRAEILRSCAPVTLPFEWPNSEGASASIAPAGAGCEVTIVVTSAVIVDRDTIVEQLASIGELDATALVGIDVELVELVLTAGDGSSLDGAITAAAVRIDGQPIFMGVSPGVQSPPPRGALPETTAAGFRAALTQPADVRADLELRFVFADPSAIPTRLGVRVVLQPIFLVDVVRAAL